MKLTATDIRLPEILSKLGPMIWTKDIRSGEVTFLTQNFEAVFEYPMHLIRLDPGILRTCVHPDDQPFLEIFSKNLLTYHVECQEYRIITPSGKTKWIQEKKQLTQNEQGEISRVDVLLLEITEQKTEETRLLESEKTFKALFFKNPTPAWIYDTESLYFLAVNEAALRFYGYTQDEFFRMTIRHIRPEEDVQDLLLAIQNNELEERSRQTWRHIRKDGTILYVRLQSCPIQFRGIPARMVQAHDVTQQVLAEVQTEKVYRYLERFQEAVSGNSMLGLLDEQGILVYANENLLQKTGKAASQLLGKSWKTLLGEGDFRDLAVLESVLKKGKTWRGERRFHFEGSGQFWADCAFIPILDPQENPGQFLFIAHDISRLKDAENRNLEYAQKLHQTLEGVTDALFVVDKDWTLTHLNQETERLFQKSRDQLLGARFWDLLPEDHSQDFFQFFRKAKKGRTTVQFEAWYAPLAGWFDISLYPSEAGLAVCFRNVTERRHKEEERRELLEQLIAQNRDLEEFTFITSHSLRAQIANLSMLCSVMDGSGLTPSNQDIFEKIYQCSGNLDSIIGDLNTILTIKDRKNVQTERVSADACLLHAISRLGISFSPLKKYIHRDTEPDLSWICIRPYVETILFQLLSNALRFRALDREPQVRVRAWQQGDSVFFTIRDNGLGLDVEKVEKQLFHLYKTFHAGSSGRGLGLYLSKILADELGGSIRFESTPGLGSEVTLRFPAQGTDSLPPTATPEETPKSGG